MFGIPLTLEDQDSRPAIDPFNALMYMNTEERKDPESVEKGQTDPYFVSISVLMVALTDCHLRTYR